MRNITAKHYSFKTLRMVNTDLSQQREHAYDRVETYLRDRFPGLDIPKSCIRRAFNECFQGATTQDMLNNDVKNYLLNNLANM